LRDSGPFGFEPPDHQHYPRSSSFTVQPDAAPRPPDNDDRGDRDGAIGYVEDRPVMDMQEIDHVPAHEGRLAQDPGGEVAQGTAQDAAQTDSPADISQPRRRPDHDDYHNDGQYAQSRGQPGSQAERRAGVTRQDQIEDTRNDFDHPAARQGGHRPRLSQLI